MIHSRRYVESMILAWAVINLQWISTLELCRKHGDPFQHVRKKYAFLVWTVIQNTGSEAPSETKYLKTSLIRRFFRFGLSAGMGPESGF